jgi:hypothetical protein
MSISNDKIRNHKFLTGMYSDGYFPDSLVDKIKAILLGLCEQVEHDQPKDDESLLKLTHAATEQINDLAQEFGENGSELETVAREVMADDFRFIVCAYGFEDIEIEDVIAPRDW